MKLSTVLIGVAVAGGVYFVGKKLLAKNGAAAPSDGTTSPVDRAVAAARDAMNSLLGAVPRAVGSMPDNSPSAAVPMRTGDDSAIADGTGYRAQHLAIPASWNNSTFKSKAMTGELPGDPFTAAPVRN